MEKITSYEINTERFILGINNDIFAYSNMEADRVKDSLAYVQINSFDSMEINRTVHLYLNENENIIVEEYDKNSKVTVVTDIESVAACFDILKDTYEIKETLDISYEVLLKAVYDKMNIKQLALDNGDVSEKFAEELEKDIYKIDKIEWYVGLNRISNEVYKLAFFVSGDNLWRVIPSEIPENIRVKKVSGDIYKQSIRTFLKGVVPGEER